MSTATAQWQAATGIPADRYVRVIESVDSRLFAGTSQGLYRSEDGGLTWVPSSTGLKSGQVFALIAAGNRILAGTDSGCFASSDHGNSWTLSDSGLYGNKPAQFAATPTAIFAGVWTGSVISGRGVYRSTNGGATWVPANQGIESTRPHSLIAIGNVLLIGSNALTYRSDDAGATWAPSPTGAERDIVNDFAFMNGTLYASMYSTEMARSTDTGKTWTLGAKGNSSDDMDTVGQAVLACFAGNVGFVAGATGWQGGAQPLSQVNAIGHNATHVFAGTLSGVIWRRPRSEMLVGLRPRPHAGRRTENSSPTWFDANGRLLPELTSRVYRSFPLNTSVISQ
jgi:hypothetical protein